MVQNTLRLINHSECQAIFSNRSILEANVYYFKKYVQKIQDGLKEIFDFEMGVFDRSDPTGFQL